MLLTSLLLEYCLMIFLKYAEDLLCESLVEPLIILFRASSTSEGLVKSILFLNWGAKHKQIFIVNSTLNILLKL